MKFAENVLLKNHTTFKIGGLARYFFKAKNKEELINSLRWAKKNKTPFFILGNGSNILVSDKGYNGLVVKIEDRRYKIKTGRRTYLLAAAGVSLATLVRNTGKRGLSGLEWASGLPGTLGGAVFGNAGAFGGEMKDNIVWVEALDKSLRVRKLYKEQCRFGYRTSIFKKRGWIVLSVKMLLKRGDKKRLQAIARSRIKERKEKGPLEYPNAGSIFKNCDIKKVPKKVVRIFKDVIKKDPFEVIPAAAIIARTGGLIGAKIGNAEVSTKHPNFIVNLGNARATDVIKLIKLVKKKVKNRFEVELEEEIKLL